MSEKGFLQDVRHNLCVGSAEALRRKYHAVLYCEADDLAGDKMYPLSEAEAR